MSKAAGQRRGGGNGKPEAPTTPNPARKSLPSGLQGGIFEGGKYGYLKALRREDARERQEVRDARSPQEQLAVLDRRLAKPGAGVAKRERARLLAEIARSK